MAHCCTLLLYGLVRGLKSISRKLLTSADGRPDAPPREPRLLIAGDPLPARLSRSRAQRFGWMNVVW